MKKYYECEWLGIYFDSFAKTSRVTLAGPTFYELFYKEFFSRYSSWDNLSFQWLEEKRAIAKFLFQKIKDLNSILSIGWGGLNIA